VVLLAAIVELNVGIVVGCMPVIQRTILSHLGKALRFSGVRSLISRLSSKANAFNRRAMNPGASQEWSMKGRPHIQTDILQGVDGKGKFMSSWLSRSRGLMGTWASGRNESDRTTAIGTQSSLNDIVMATSISSHSRCDSNSTQEQDTDKDDIRIQTQTMRDMV
jgi:hypothetical protein